MTGWEIFWWITAGIIVIPIFVYLVVKMGSSAFYKARMEYIKEAQKEAHSNGKDAKES